MIIKPLKHIVYLKFPEAKAGVLDTSSRPSAVEFAEVEAVGEDCGELKKGDKIFVKSWGVDIITHEDKVYRFVNIDTGGILAIIKE